jgi:hypothetical protein
MYYGAAFCTGLAGFSHLMLIPNSINFITYAIFFLISGYGTTILGLTDDKKMGHDLVPHWDCRDNYHGWFNRILIVSILLTL